MNKEIIGGIDKWDPERIATKNGTNLGKKEGSHLYMSVNTVMSIKGRSTNQTMLGKINLTNDCPKICNNIKYRKQNYAKKYINPTSKTVIKESKNIKSFARIEESPKVDLNRRSGSINGRQEHVREEIGVVIGTGLVIEIEPVSLKLALWNIRSLEANKLREVLKINADIVTLNEIGNKFTTEVNIQGYKYFENLRCRRSGGGTGILVKNNLGIKIVKHSMEDTLISKITINRSLSLILISTYFSPEYIKFVYNRIHAPVAQWIECLTSNQ